jgi:hypothetical protein
MTGPPWNGAAPRQECRAPTDQTNPIPTTCPCCVVCSRTALHTVTTMYGGGRIVLSVGLCWRHWRDRAENRRLIASAVAEHIRRGGAA